MKQIQLTKGRAALVDDAMFDLLNSFRWCAHADGGNFYAIKGIQISRNKQIQIKMHHVIAGHPLNGLVIDHINRNGLDNRRENLRIVTRRENCLNKKLDRGARIHSDYPGVCWSKKAEKWLARIWIGKKRAFLGLFSNETDAARAYEAAKGDIG